MEFGTLSKIYDKKNNSFTILGIIASLLIIYFHCYPLFYGADTTIVDIFTKNCGSEALGGVIVAMFFVISGFMITTSIKNSKNTSSYLKRE